MISIHALLAESDTNHAANALGNGISIHALLAESDAITLIRAATQRIFLSTLSLRRATTLGLDQNATAIDFYPRSPCGERLYNPTDQTITITDFYPRSPCGERPTPAVLVTTGVAISIHALLAESDNAQ